MSVCKGQGWKLLLNARDHRALRQYCLRNRHATMMDIATWAREYFWKIIVTQHSALSEFSGPKVIWDGPKVDGNMFSGQMSPTFQLVFGKKRKSDSTYQR